MPRPTPLTSRKLVAALAGLAGLLLLAALQSYRAALSESQFALLATGIIVLSGGATTLQALIDYVKAKAP